MGNSGWLAAFWANQHYLGGIHGAFRVNDTALLAHTARLYMLFDHVAAFDDNLLLFGADLKNLTLLAVVFAGQNDDCVALFYMKYLSTHGMLVVPDKQMDDFRFMMDLSPDGVSFDDASLTMGSRVKVVKGELSGVEGEVGTVSNRTYVVIRIRGVLTASVKLPRSYLKIIG